MNYAREFVGYLTEIMPRDNLSATAVIRQISIDQEAPHKNQKLQLREELQKLRFPGGKGYTLNFSQKLHRPRKKQVDFARQKGEWLKRCPGTPKHICCNYLIINSIVGCPYDCTYCFLHEYLNRPGITIYNNLQELMAKLQDFFWRNTETHFRVGTGELSDSLALDQKTGISKQLIALFAAQDDHLLELKTKSAEVDHLLGLKHCGKTVLAWSVNPEKIVRSEELGTASLSERLQAAKKASSAGYPVAFHFDPLIFYPGWAKDYREVVDQIFAAVTKQQIAWISLGALRFPPRMKELIFNLFPHSPLPLTELRPDVDGKIRFPAKLRLEMFKQMIRFIRQYSTKTYLYLCMESPAVWSQLELNNPINNNYAKYFRFFRKML